MNVLVCGSLAWTSEALIRQELAQLPEDTVILEGEAPGADLLARKVALKMGLKVRPFVKNPTDGKAADRVRDRRMFDEGKPELVLIFHNDIENSQGSKEQRQRSIKRSVAFKVIRDDNQTTD